MKNVDETLLSIEASLASFTKRLDDNATERLSEMRKCSFFDPVPGEWLKLISDQAEIRKFSTDDCLTSEGDDSHTFYVVLYGTATVFCDHKVVGRIVSGECIGEGTFFISGSVSRSATVIADGELIVAEIDKTGIAQLQSNAMVKSYMDRALLLALFKKLQGANRKIQELMR